MWIKEIVIDGFKSFSRRVVISDLDPKFNAITGLNGSGKSNIIDAICFALGLSSLALARATVLQELVYLNGHGGVNTAHVTLKFDNSNIKESPVGFEAQQHITVSRTINGGRCKFFLEGKVVHQKAIKGLLKTLHLNIDNPHFLVSQGRITSMIQLKPVVLASLIEETAGTALYNEKKKDATHILAKKEEKLKQVNTLVKTEIEPNLDKLKKEKELYQRYLNLDVDLNKFKKFMYAYEYYEQRKFLESRNMDLTTKHNWEHDVRNRLNKALANKAKIEKEKAELIAANERDTKKFKELKAACKRQKKDFTSLEFEINNLERNVKEAEKEKEKTIKRINDLEADIVRLDQRIVFSESSLEKLTKEQDEKKALLDQYETQLISVMKGEKISSDEKIFFQIKETEVKLTTVESEIKQYQLRKTHLTNELESLKSRVEEGSKLISVTETELQDIENEISYMEKKLMSYNVSDNEYKDYINAHCDEKIKLDRVSLKLNEIIANNPAFNFRFKDQKKYTQQQVRGRLFQLFSVHDTTFSKSVEAIAKPFLYSVVVDHQDTAKNLIKAKAFGSNRVNFIPNSSIVPRVIPQNSIELANDIAKQYKGKVTTIGSHIIRFDQEILQTIQFIFGDTIVCSSSEIAQKVAFHPKIRRRCVNLEGDIFDPAGTLTGGFQNAASSVLLNHADYRKHLAEYEETKNKVRQLEEVIKNYKDELDSYNKLKNEIDIKIHKKTLIEKKLKSDPYNKTIERKESLNLQLKDLNEQMEMLHSQKMKYEKELEECKKERDEFSKNRNSQDFYLKQREKLTAEVTKVQSDLRKAKSDKSNSEVEKEQAEKELKKRREDVIVEEEAFRRLKESLDNNRRQLDGSKVGYTKADEERRELDKSIEVNEEKQAKLLKEETKLQLEINKYELGLPTIINTINTLNDEIKECNSRISAMERAENWLISEHKNFGIAGTEYDFDNMDIEKEKMRFQAMKDEKERLSKRVNFDIDSAYAKLLNDFNKLSDKRKILEGDKKILTTAINRLDRMRERSIDTCFKKVNKNFGRLFSNFLPGSDAKLETVQNNMQIDSGVQIAFAFNGVWKHTLSELSGGQRSLLALSYVLAMLMYKPAPFYILDEIDAALDLSHTDNIGAIFSKHFPQSQFILITLKEELFKHANKVYKVYFKNGRSEVERILSQGKFVNAVEDERRMIDGLE